MWLADLKALNKEKYLFRGFVPVQDLISLAWAKALWATERRGIPRKWGSTPRYIWSRGGIGRRCGLKIHWIYTVWVQVPPRLPLYAQVAE